MTTRDERAHGGTTQPADRCCAQLSLPSMNISCRIFRFFQPSSARIEDWDAPLQAVFFVWNGTSER